jgi:hypothetical protein
MVGAGPPRPSSNYPEFCLRGDGWRPVVNDLSRLLAGPRFVRAPFPIYSQNEYGAVPGNVAGLLGFFFALDPAPFPAMLLACWGFSLPLIRPPQVLTARQQDQAQGEQAKQDKSFPGPLHALSAAPERRRSRLRGLRLGARDLLLEDVAAARGLAARRSDLQGPDPESRPSHIRK